MIRVTVQQDDIDFGNASSPSWRGQSTIRAEYGAARYAVEIAIRKALGMPETKNAASKGEDLLWIERWNGGYSNAVVVIHEHAITFVDDDKKKEFRREFTEGGSLRHWLAFIPDPKIGYIASPGHEPIEPGYQFTIERNLH